MFQQSAEHGVGVRAVGGERFVGTNEEVGREAEVVGDGAVDGVAATEWVDDLDVSPAIPGPRLPGAWSLGSGQDVCIRLSAERKSHKLTMIHKNPQPSTARHQTCALRNYQLQKLYRERMKLDLIYYHPETHLLVLWYTIHSIRVVTVQL